MSLRLVPITLREANALVSSHHRHHKASRGHRFSIGAELDGTLVGAAIVGRPVSASTPWRTTAEVARLVTDGTPHACSLLYAACARAAKAMGYETIQTFTLAEEPGTSLVAAGWTQVGTTDGDTWTGREGRPGRRSDQPLGPKRKWQRDLR